MSRVILTYDKIAQDTSRVILTYVARSQVTCYIDESRMVAICHV